MKGPIGEKPLTHAEKLLVETSARLDKATQALRSLRAVVRKQHAEKAALRQAVVDMGAQIEALAKKIANGRESSRFPTADATARHHDAVVAAGLDPTTGAKAQS